MLREQNRICSSWSGLTSGPLHSLAWHFPFQGLICVACFDSVYVQWMRKGSEIPDKPMSNMPAACWAALGDQGKQQTWGISELRAEYYLGLCCKVLSSSFVGMVWLVRRTTFSVAFNNQIGDFTFTLILMKLGCLKDLTQLMYVFDIVMREDRVWLYIILYTGVEWFKGSFTQWLGVWDHGKIDVVLLFFFFPNIDGVTGSSYVLSFSINVQKGTVSLRTYV